MSAQRLREAAALMRSRAESLNRADAHGPWRAHHQHVVRDERAGPALVMIASEGVQGCVLPVYRDISEHIASWHPAVALAVADLLEIVEAGYEDYEPDGEAQSQMQIVSAWADNLANAYLGAS